MTRLVTRTCPYGRVMMRSRPRRQRSRGAVDELPSGALRVRVYAGADPLTGKRHDLVEVIHTAARGLLAYLEDHTHDDEPEDGQGEDGEGGVG